MKQSVLDFINRFWRAHYYSPSIRDICAGAGINSTSHVMRIVKSLETEHKLYYGGGEQARRITPMWIVEAIDAQKTA